MSILRELNILYEPSEVSKYEKCGKVIAEPKELN